MKLEGGHHACVYARNFAGSPGKSFILLLARACLNFSTNSFTFGTVWNDEIYRKKLDFIIFFGSLSYQ